MKKSDSIVNLGARLFGLFVFGFLLIAANTDARGQLADAYNPKPNDAVFVIQPQSDGKIIIGGFFTNVRGQSRSRLARLNADGTPDTTFANTNLTEPVRVVALQPDGKILVGTVVTSGSQTANQLFRFNTDGTLDTSFNSNVNNGVYAIAPQPDGKIIIGGVFTGVNGQPLNYLARLNANGTTDNTFTTTSDAAVRVMTKQPDGKILVGGLFSNIGGAARNRLARLNADGTFDNTFTLPTFYDSGKGVQSIVLQPDGKIVIGGFASGDGSLNIVARLNANGAPDTAFNQNVESIDAAGINTRAVAVQSDGKILFGVSAVRPLTSLIRLNADGTTDRTFNPYPTSRDIPVSSVDALVVQTDQKILVGGYFTQIGGASRNHFARLLSDSVSVPVKQFDFDGDNKADMSAFRPSNGVWVIYRSTVSLLNAPQTLNFGLTTDRLAPADYDGDFKTDIAVFRPGAQGYFYMIQSKTNTFRAEAFGTTGDVPAVGDWDGDLKADLAVYRNGSAAGQQSYFYYRPISGSAGFIQIAWGTGGDKPVVGDYDADGKQDAAVFRPSNGIWYVARSSDNQVQAAQFGLASDKLVPADYDGDRKTDYAVFRNGVWYIENSQIGYISVQFGTSGDLPAPADYDGDSIADFAILRNGYWYFIYSSGGSFGGPYSAAGDVPVPGAYVQ